MSAYKSTNWPKMTNPTENSNSPKMGLINWNYAVFTNPRAHAYVIAALKICPNWLNLSPQHKISRVFLSHNWHSARGLCIALTTGKGAILRGGPPAWTCTNGIADCWLAGGGVVGSTSTLNCGCIGGMYYIEYCIYRYYIHTTAEWGGYGEEGQSWWHWNIYIGSVQDQDLKRISDSPSLCYAVTNRLRLFDK